MSNHSSDPHSYEVHVYTGLKSNSGTDSNINLIVAGSESDSGVRELSDGVRKVLCNLFSGINKIDKLSISMIKTHDIQVL